MIFENQDEKEAFELVCDIASEATSRAGCNDLDSEQRKKFGHLQVETTDEGKQVMREVIYDFDVLYWLQTRAKGP